MSNGVGLFLSSIIWIIGRIETIILIAFLFWTHLILQFNLKLIKESLYIHS